MIPLIFLELSFRELGSHDSGGVHEESIDQSLWLEEVHHRHVSFAPTVVEVGKGKAAFLGLARYLTSGVLRGIIDVI